MSHRVCGGTFRSGLFFLSRLGVWVPAQVRWLSFPSKIKKYQPLLLGTNIAPSKALFEDGFPFPIVGYVSSLQNTFSGFPCFINFLFPLVLACFCYHRHPQEEARRSNMRHRPVGLGVQGTFFFSDRPGPGWRKNTPKKEKAVFLNVEWRVFLLDVGALSLPGLFYMRILGFRQTSIKELKV